MRYAGSYGITDVEGAVDETFERALKPGPGAIALRRLLDDLPREAEWPEERIFKWLFGIQHNVCMDIFRASAKQVPLCAPDEAENVPARDAADPEKSVLHREQTAILRDCIRELPSHERAVLELFARDIGPADISKILGLSPATVVTQLIRGTREVARLFRQRLFVGRFGKRGSDG